MRKRARSTNSSSLSRWNASSNPGSRGAVSARRTGQRLKTLLLRPHQDRGGRRSEGVEGVDAREARLGHEVLQSLGVVEAEAAVLLELDQPAHHVAVVAQRF